MGAATTGGLLPLRMGPLWVAGGLTGAAIACVVWGIFEAKMFRTVHYQIPILDKGSAPIDILQVSDLHLRTDLSRLIRFVRSLGDKTYDFVLATGDLLGEPDAVDVCSSILNGLHARHGRFVVFGSSDYYAPTFKNYADYFLGRRRHGTKRNPTAEFLGQLEAAGWTDLTNTTAFTKHGDRSIQWTGMDDPYLKRDDRSVLVRKEGADLAICVVHDPAPYLDSAKAGFDLQISGHTHGGQVRFPFVGALVTNSTLPRNLARGLSRVGGSWLFVTPGLGTGRFAPFRFLCRPEASVLRLVPRS